MKRIESIDLFRGLTIALMVFVNDIASVPDAPVWLHHVDATTDGMTLPDLVFPAFLFIVGMVIPAALKKRLQEGFISALKHIGARSMALIIMGVMMLNSGAYNPALSLLPKPIWQLFMYLSFFMIWNLWPEGTKRKQIIPAAGWGILLILLITYRRGTVENPAWIQTGWWGILGLIGWAYGVASLIYLFFRERKEYIILSMVFGILLFVAEISGRLAFMQPVVNVIHPGKFIGIHTLIVLAGLLAGLNIMEGKHRAVVRFILVEGILLWLAGWLLHGEYILSKIQATPVWALQSSACCCLIFVIIYILTDIKGWKNWGKPFQPSAQNPLTAYLLPGVFYILFDLLSIPYFTWGKAHAAVGILRSVLFTGMILLITHFLTQAKIRLKL